MTSNLPSDTGPYEGAEATLTKELHALMMPVSRSFVDDLQLGVVESTSDFVNQSLTLRLQGHIWEQPLKHEFFDHPDTLWDHVKHAYAPQWFLRVWPVKYKRYEVKVAALYPHLVYRTEAYAIHVRVGRSE